MTLIIINQSNHQSWFLKPGVTPGPVTSLGLQGVHAAMLVHVQRSSEELRYAAGHIGAAQIATSTVVTPRDHAAVVLQHCEGVPGAVHRDHTTAEIHAGTVRTIPGIGPSENAAVGLQSCEGTTRDGETWT